MPRHRLLRLRLLLERLERAGPILARRPGGGKDIRTNRRHFNSDAG